MFQVVNALMSLGTTGADPLRRKEMPPQLGRDGRPKAYVCYLCGCQFGSKSLFIHIANCQEKWLKKEANKAKGMSRPLPLPPAELEAGEVPTSHEGIERESFSCTSR
jgi:hypothetical protein